MPPSAFMIVYNDSLFDDLWLLIYKQISAYSPHILKWHFPEKDLINCLNKMFVTFLKCYKTLSSSQVLIHEYL